jgi:DNA-directed RNA polymerase subunit L/DNA-directed RNA polymerase alpha subunit
VILTGVETVAFRSDMNDKGTTSDVVVVSNTTPMTNEMLADRIGLLPIHVPDPLQWNPEEYIFRLNVVNDSAETKPVLASDFEVLQRKRPDEDPVQVPNTKFFPPDAISKETCLIAVLKGKQANQTPQKIELTAKASVGIGREHIRFSPVSQCSYSYTIDTDEARQKTFFERWLVANKKVDPQSLEQDPARKEILEREFQTMEVQRCFLISEKGEPYSFDFVVETVGIQSVQNILDRALQNIETKLALYANLDRGSLPETVRVQPADARMKGFDFIFGKEDHTLGNLLQTWMDENLMDTGEITFVGYKVPHPLRDEMVLRVGVEDGQETTARSMVARAASGCATMFRGWREDWMRASAGGLGQRSRKSLRPNVNNAKALEEAAASVPTMRSAAAAAAAAPQRKSAFYGSRQAQAQAKGKV